MYSYHTLFAPASCHHIINLSLPASCPPRHELLDTSCPPEASVHDQLVTYVPAGYEDPTSHLSAPYPL
jgi:hypothetical protein